MIILFSVSELFYNWDFFYNLSSDWRLRLANYSRSYYGTIPPKVTVSAKADYPPPPAHSRLAPSKTTEKLTSIHQSMIPKSKCGFLHHKIVYTIHKNSIMVQLG